MSIHSNNKPLEPLVTIGLPFYNPGIFFPIAIKSILSQTYKNWELIAVNDGSTDDSLAFISNIKDHRIIIVNDGKNLGLPRRLNQISQMAHGNYIARMDSDDIMHPERIAKQISILIENPDIDIVDCACVTIDVNNTPVNIRNTSTLPTIYDIFKHGGYAHPTIMGKSAWFLSNPYSEEGIYLRSQDRELFVRTYRKTVVKRAIEPLFFYRYDGHVKVQSFLKSYQGERQVLLKEGIHHIGLTRTSYLYFRSIAKSIILKILSLLKKEQIIAKKTKFQEINPELLIELRKVIHKITTYEITRK